MSSAPCVRPARACSTACASAAFSGTTAALVELSLAFDGQHAVAALLAEILDVGAYGLGDP